MVSASRFALIGAHHNSGICRFKALGAATSVQRARLYAGTVVVRDVTIDNEFRILVAKPGPIF